MTSDTDNPYWNGDTHAVLRREAITADWATTPYSGLRIDAANRAFCIWYHANQTLSESVTDPHWGEMWETMRACANEGWGLGVSDLRESLWHYAENGGRWTDDNTRIYMGGRGNSYARALITDVPEGPCNFLRAVDDRLPQLRRAMEVYQQKCDAIRQLRPSASSSRSDWDRMKDDISAIKTAAERVKPLMWMMPAAVTARLPNTSAGLSAARRIEEFADGGAQWLDRSIKILDVVGKITDGVTVYTEASRAMGGDSRAGIAFAALHYSMNFVPVLGSFYGAIVAKIPGLIENWRDFMADYTRRFDNPEAWLRERARRRPAWRCEICGSSGGY